MTERPVGVTDQTSGAGVADVRTRERSVGGNTVAEQYVIPQPERVVQFRGVASTFRMIGSTATPQWHFQMANTAGSAYLICVRSIEVHQDAGTVLLAAVAPTFSVDRPTGTAAAGTNITATSVGTGENTAQTVGANTAIKGGASADGTNSLITGLTPGAAMWRAFGTRFQTLAGQMVDVGKELVPPALRPDGLILRAGEQIGVRSDHAAAANNIASFNYTVSVIFEEYTLP